MHYSVLNPVLRERSQSLFKQLATYVFSIIYTNFVKDYCKIFNKQFLL